MTIASIDIGTNTILLLIAEIDIRERRIKTISNEFRIPRIGKGLYHGGRILTPQIEAMFDILEQYYKIILNHRCNQILVTATNAFRIASNNMELVKQIKSKFNFDVKIISGEEEARYSYLGATFNLKGKGKNLIIDIGGGSTEIVFGEGINISYSKSFLIGAVACTEKYLKHDPPLALEIDNLGGYISTKFEGISINQFQADSAIAIAGTPTTLACIKQGLTSFDEELIEGSILTIQDINKLFEEISNLSSKDILKKYKTVVKGREDVLLSGTFILERIMRLMGLNSVSVSTKGIRYGAIVDFLLSNSYL
ncbi:MAG: Ppx/GppA phosphatase family protein [Ignavibacteriaceae bacterium]